MADDIVLDAASGTFTAAGDDVGGVLYQKIKLFSASDGDARRLDKDEDAAHTTGDPGIMALAVRSSDANSLTPLAGADGDYIPLVVDSRGVLQVVNRARDARISTTSAGLTIATTAYTIGDQVGTILTIAGAAIQTGGTGEIRSITVLDEGDVCTDLCLWFFNQSVTLAADNAAFAISDADMRNLCGYVQMPSMRDMGANRVTTLGNVGLGYDCAATSLFCAIETRTANSFFAAVGDLKVILNVARN